MSVAAEPGTVFILSLLIFVSIKSANNNNHNDSLHR